MSIIIDDKCLGVYQTDHKLGNLLGAIRDLGEGKLEVTIRIRINVDDKIWDSQDKKKWMQWEVEQPFEVVRAKVLFVFGTVPGRCSEVREILRDETGAEGIMKRIVELPGMHKIELPARGNLH